MKKLLALSLAALMVMGLATVGFAANGDVYTVHGGEATLKSTVEDSADSVNGVEDVWTRGFHENTDGVVEMTIAKKTASGLKDKSYIQPGKTIYYPLHTNSFDVGPDAADFNFDFVELSEAVKSVSFSTKYTLGNELLESAKIVYKKYTLAYDVEDNTVVPAGFRTDTATGYAYFLALTMKSSTSTATKDFAADITVKKSSGNDKTDSNESLAFKFVAAVSLQVKFDVAGDARDLVKNSYNVFNFKAHDNKAEITGDHTINFDKFDGAYFEVDVTGQEKMIIKADAKYDAAVAGKYPSANINFFNGYNATFNKIGELRLPAEPGSYLYAIAADGTLKALKAEYDDGEECFVIKTRTLGYYAISDKELDIAPAVVEPSAPTEAPSAPAETPAPVEPGKTNPGTGAAA